MTPEQALIKVLGFGPKVFIEKAIEGGWNPTEEKEWIIKDSEEDGTLHCYFYSGEYPDEGCGAYSYSEILLDPLAWEAVGKVDGWKKEPYLCEGCRTIGVGTSNHMAACPIKNRKSDYLTYMHRFIDALCEIV